MKVRRICTKMRNRGAFNLPFGIVPGAIFSILMSPFTITGFHVLLKHETGQQELMDGWTLLWRSLRSAMTAEARSFTGKRERYQEVERTSLNVA